MNQYASEIRARWQERAPQQVAEMENSTRFFRELGEEVAATVERLMPQLLDPPLQDESYLQRIQRWERARRKAMELAYDDVSWPTPEQEEISEEDLWLEFIPQINYIQAVISWVENPTMGSLDLAEEMLLPEDFLMSLTKMDQDQLFTFLLDNPTIVEGWKALFQHQRPQLLAQARE